MISSKHADNANWITCGFAIAILVTRLVVARHSPHVTALCKALCIFSILVISLRIPVIWLVLRYGTVANALGSASTANSVNLRHVKIGSILTLVARLLATTFYWLQTAILLRFYTHVTGHIEWCRKAITCCWATIFLTYIACVLTTFLECRPLNLYWRLNPSVDHCTRAYIQIFVQGIFNILLDLMLIVISIPLWTGQKFTVPQTLRIGILLSTGTFCIIVTGVKLHFVVGAKSHQQARTFWASIQILVSTFVANVPTIYGSVRLAIRRRQEQKVRRASRPDEWHGVGMSSRRSREEATSSRAVEIVFITPSFTRDKVDVEHREYIP